MFQDPSSTVVLERILSAKGLKFEAHGSSPVLGVWPKQKDNAEMVKSIYLALKEESKKVLLMG